MNNQDEQGVSKVFHEYFTAAKIRREEAGQIIKIAQHFGKKGWHNKFMDMFFHVLKSALKKETFVVTCQRFLHMLDEILSLEGDKSIRESYRLAISNSIVSYYTFIFSLIFEFRQVDLILDFKVYRLRWAKKITDTAFESLRSEISKKHRNFDLGKGFPADMLEKVRNKLRKRGFSEEEIIKYTGSVAKTEDKKKEQRLEEKDSELSSEEYEGQQRKKLKMDETAHSYSWDGNQPFSHKIEYEDSMHEPEGWRTNNNQNESVYTNTYFNYPNPVNCGSDSFAKSFSNSYYVPQNPIPNLPNSMTFHASKDPRKTLFEGLSQTRLNEKNFQSKKHEIVFGIDNSKIEKETKVKEINQVESMRKAHQSLLLNLKQGLNECPHCGMHFLIKLNLESHLKDVFLDSQKLYAGKESTGAVVKSRPKFNLNQLQTSERWPIGFKSNQPLKANYEISVGNFGNKQRVCYFCNEEMAVNFSERLQDWAMEGIRIEAGGRIEVAHFNCYECWRWQENSLTFINTNQLI